jgi:hypothetical protein
MVPTTLCSLNFLNISPLKNIGDQFLNTGNDFAARAVCPCIWITSPEETTYILKTVLRLSGVAYQLDNEKEARAILSGEAAAMEKKSSNVDFTEMARRTKVVQEMDVFTGEISKK